MRLVNVGIEYRVPRPGSRRRLVSLGDGGHSENLGAFALLRRRCQRVIIVDAEHDPRYEFAGYRRLKESARRDLGIELIVPDVEEALANKESDFGNAVSMGMATSGGGTSDMAIQYIKLCLDRSRLSDYPDSVVSYDADHRQSFPHQSTGDQYFPPEQYRAYRDLGYHTLMVHGI